MYIGFPVVPIGWSRFQFPDPTLVSVSDQLNWSLALIPSRLLNLHTSAMKMETPYPFETWISAYRFTQCHMTTVSSELLSLMHLPMQFYSRHDVTFPWVWIEFRKISKWDIKADGFIDFSNRDRWNRGSACTSFLFICLERGRIALSQHSVYGSRRC
jgi:hypothetical protein